MSIKLSDVAIKTQLPTLPKSVPVFRVMAQSIEERRPAVRLLADRLALRDLREVPLHHGVVMAGKDGDITIFHASGAVLARDARAAHAATDEMRKWEGQVDSKVGGERISLPPDVAKRLIGQTKDMLQSFGLIGKEVASEAVQLEQVAHLDAKGKELAYGAGQATVKFSYALEGRAVRGAGAKTMAFVEPGDGQPRYAGLFHAWRSVGAASPVKLASLEESLAAGLLTDPELVRHHAAGHQLELHRLELAYLALPAFTQQSHLIPVFQVEGKVSKGRLGIGFDFARFHHAVPAKAYAAADLHGAWLTVNPDGIAPAANTNEMR